MEQIINRSNRQKKVSNYIKKDIIIEEDEELRRERTGSFDLGSSLNSNDMNQNYD
jgi:hypothetical protein